MSIPVSASAHVELEEVSFRYASLRRDQPSILALEDISLSIPPGRFVAIVGPSGSGKSTLLRLIAGLLRPTSGLIRINGEPVTAPRSDVGFVFQQPTLLPWQRVHENVMLPATLVGWKREEARERAAEMLALVGLTGFEERYPAELSGGMQQRAAIARALILNPQLLLLDEPFSALDALLREDLAVELERIWLAASVNLQGDATRRGDHPPTILLVTHSITEAVMLADLVVVLSPHPGTVVGQIPVELPRPRGRSALESPDAFALTAQVRATLEQSRKPSP